MVTCLGVGCAFDVGCAFFWSAASCFGDGPKVLIGGVESSSFSGTGFIVALGSAATLAFGRASFANNSEGVVFAFAFAAPPELFLNLCSLAPRS